MITKAAHLITTSKRISVFTGAGISVESGIPPFRGEGGLWSQYNPIILDLDYYLNHTDQSWPIIKKLFFDFFGQAKPNQAHQILASWENQEIIHEVITQNIDNLHQDAGSKIVHEFHGTASSFMCTKCGNIYNRSTIELNNEPPHCKSINCRGLLKPNFIFFGEGIPAKAYEASMIASKKSDLFIVIGTTGEIMPASQIPILAKNNGAKIIEINTSPSSYTNSITDIFLQDKASIALNQLNEQLSRTFC
jgi:NAD-dependent deacetylase